MGELRDHCLIMAVPEPATLTLGVLGVLVLVGHNANQWRYRWRLFKLNFNVGDIRKKTGLPITAIKKEVARRVSSEISKELNQFPIDGTAIMCREVICFLGMAFGADSFLPDAPANQAYSEWHQKPLFIRCMQYPCLATKSLQFSWSWGRLFALFGS